jgi:hypothetical protein
VIRLLRIDLVSKVLAMIQKALGLSLGLACYLAIGTHSVHRLPNSPRKSAGQLESES